MSLLESNGPKNPISISLAHDGQSQSGSGTNSDFPYDLHNEGDASKRRFEERLDRKIRERLPDLIGQVPIDGKEGDVIHVTLPPEARPIFQKDPHKTKGYGSGEGQPGDIIAQGPGQGNGEKGGHGEGEGGYEFTVPIEKILAMAFEEWELPDLEEKRVGQITEDEVVWNDRRPKGPFANLNKKATLIANIKRNAMAGRPAKVANIRDEDHRYTTWNVTEKPITNAVVVAMMDVSGSMREQEKLAAKIILLCSVVFLRSKYDAVKIVFITHHSSAQEVDEDLFFHTSESGGTEASTAFALANTIVDTRYSPNDWNVYPFYVGDGDNWTGDDEEGKLKKSVATLLGKSRRIFYAETRPAAAPYPWASEDTNLMNTFGTIADPRIITAKVTDKPSIYTALETFFKKQEGREGRVNKS